MQPSLISTLVSLSMALSTVSAGGLKGFNYGNVNTEGAPYMQEHFEALFEVAKNLDGAEGFNSARLYTMIQAGTPNTPLSAIPAAINKGTSLLLGLWASTPQDQFNQELTALKNAIEQYGDKLADLVVGISVGSEDLYRETPTGIENKSGIGASPDQLVSFIKQTRELIKGTSLENVKIGHVDTWTAWVNGSNSAVVDACDWLGMDTYPYFQNTLENSIDNGPQLFWDALHATEGSGKGKEVWVTETGWPVSGDKSNDAVASVQNAHQYWQDVGCDLFGKYNTWWYTLQDADPTVPNPSFGIIGSQLNNGPLFNLSCKAPTSSSSSSSSSAVKSESVAAPVSATDASSTVASSLPSSAASAEPKPTPSSSAVAAPSALASSSAAGANDEGFAAEVQPTSSVAASSDSPSVAPVSSEVAAVSHSHSTVADVPMATTAASNGSESGVPFTFNGAGAGPISASFFAAGAGLLAMLL